MSTIFIKTKEFILDFQVERRVRNNSVNIINYHPSDAEVDEIKVKVGVVKLEEKLLEVASNMNPKDFLVRNEDTFKIKGRHAFYCKFDVTYPVEELSILIPVLQPFDMSFFFPK